MKLLWEILEKNGVKWLNYGKKWSGREMKSFVAFRKKKRGPISRTPS